MIELYVRDNCKFCQRVLDTVSTLQMSEGVDYMLIDVNLGTLGRQVAKDVGGKEQFPFLIYREKHYTPNSEVGWMYESEDIISFLEYVREKKK